MKYTVEQALQLALASSADTSYTSDTVTAEDIITVVEPNNDPFWYVWCPKDDNQTYFTALTGHGPTSKANAIFYSVARNLVIELVAEIERLKIPRSH